MSTPTQYYSLFALLVLINLGACTQYRYVKPDTVEGMQCIEKLDAKVAKCNKRAEESVQSQRQSYEWQMVGYRACTQQTPSSAQMSQPCGAAQAQICHQDYNQSFIRCGGRLEEISGK